MGINLFFTERTMRADELAAETEARGFESLWAAGQTHEPLVSRVDHDSKAPEYWQAFDPFLSPALAAPPPRAM